MLSEERKKMKLGLEIASKSFSFFLFKSKKPFRKQHSRDLGVGDSGGGLQSRGSENCITTELIST